VRNNLRPGMSATAVITTKTEANVIAVPLQAIVEKPATPPPTPAATGSVPVPSPAGEKPKDLKGVYVLQKDGKVKFVPVETGITGESDIQILSGVDADMEIVTGPSRVLKTLKDGTKVKRQSLKPGGNANTEK